MVVFVGGFPRKKGMLRADLIEKNCGIFVTSGKALEKHAPRHVKVVVVANPANTNCYILSQAAPSIPRENFTALTRLDLNRARGILGNKLGLPSTAVKNVIIWGNHSKSQYPDVRFGTVAHGDGRHMSISQAVKDDAWLAVGLILVLHFCSALLCSALSCPAVFLPWSLLTHVTPRTKHNSHPLPRLRDVSCTPCSTVVPPSLPRVASLPR